MGAQEFTTVGRGKTAQEAFDAAVHAAQWEHGHGGYSGTIAEKHEFEEVVLPEGVPIQKFIDAAMIAGYDEAEPVPEELKPHEALVRKAGKIADDKWGPACAIRVKDEAWVFFGWASS